MAANTDILKQLSSISGLPQDLEDQLFSTIRDKLPSEIDDSVIYDIMKSNQQIIKDYYLSIR